MGRLDTLWAELLYGWFMGKAGQAGLAQKVVKMFLPVTAILDFLCN
jgi:hypothetical protein